MKGSQNRCMKIGAAVPLIQEQNNQYWSTSSSPCYVQYELSFLISIYTYIITMDTSIDINEQIQKYIYMYIYICIFPTSVEHKAGYRLPAPTKSRRRTLEPERCLRSNLLCRCPLVPRSTMATENGSTKSWKYSCRTTKGIPRAYVASFQKGNGVSKPMLDKLKSPYAPKQFLLQFILLMSSALAQWAYFTLTEAAWRAAPAPETRT